MFNIWMLWIIIAVVFLYVVIKNLGFFLMLRALRFYSRGERNKADDLFRKALAYPLRPYHKLTCAFYVLKEGGLEEAARVINPLRELSAKKFDPARAEVYYSLVLWRQGELEQAVENLESLLDNGYATETLYCNLGYLLIEKGDYERALEVNLAGLEYDSKSEVLRDNLVLNYIKLEKWENAEEISEELLKEKPDFPEPYYSRALIYINKNDRVNALELLHLAENKRFNFLSTISPGDVKDKIAEIEGE